MPKTRRLRQLDMEVAERVPSLAISNGRPFGKTRENKVTELQEVCP